MSSAREKAATSVLTVILTAACLLILAVALGFVATAIDQSNARNSPQERLVFFSDGSAAVSAFAGTDEKPRLKTLTGKPFERLAPNADARELGGVDLPVPRAAPPGSEALGWNRRMLIFHDEQPRLTIWYLIHDGYLNGRAYFVGYNGVSNARVGFIGTQGFRADNLPEEEWFPLRDVDRWGPGQVAGAVGYSMYLNLDFSYPRWRSLNLNTYSDHAVDVFINNQKKIYRVDLVERTTSTFLEGAATPYRSIVDGPLQLDDETWITAFARTDDKVFLIAAGQKLVVDLPPQLHGKSCTWMITKAGTGIAYTSDWLPEDQLHHRIYWLNAKGAVERTADVTLQQRLSMPSSIYALVVPCPLLADLMVGILHPLEETGQDSRHIYKNFGEAAAAELQKSWPTLAVLQVVAAILAVVCYRCHARYATTRGQRIAWAVFVFLFGLPGLVGYLTHRSWPVRRACPRCGAIVPRDREQCAGCREEFPLPEPSGIEIFA